MAGGGRVVDYAPGTWLIVEGGAVVDVAPCRFDAEDAAARLQEWMAHANRHLLIEVRLDEDERA